MADGPLTPPAPDAIRALRAENPKARARDFAATHGMTEADLLAAHVGHGAVAIDATPDRLVPMIRDLGDVMALTRNESCVHERRGTYTRYEGGPHAAMVLDPEIDLRIFPSHWMHGFALSEAADDGTVKRSLQVFDAAGDAVHKVHLQAESDTTAFDRLVAMLRCAEQPDRLTLTPRKPAEPPRGDASRAAALRADWDRMTDTHQFFKLVKTHKMNRLGAYRVVGDSHAIALAPQAVNDVLTGAATAAVPVMIFVGNAGCIQIHGGPIERIVPMGPWINVMDPRFNLHLRGDHIAEVWLVTKPTRTGPAVSVEAFDKDGGLILQIFGYRKDTDPAAWDALTATLPRLAQVPA